MPKKVVIAKTIGVVAVLMGAVGTGLQLYKNNVTDPRILNDVSRLNQTRVEEVITPRTENDLVRAIKKARRLGWKVSLSGTKHSQGGQAFYHDALHLDMTSFNRIIALDTAGKSIRVQSGVTWNQIQDHVNPHGLSVAVMQSSNIFTVGGSLSANVHGRDPRFGPIIETVLSFRLLTADGEILNVSRTENSELFTLAIGGFGLFGVILDVELQLTENRVYSKRSAVLDYTQYPAFLEQQVVQRPEVGIHFGRLSIEADTLLREGYVVTYTETADRPEGVFELAEEQHVSRDKFVFGLSRKQDWAKKVRWHSQKKWVDVPGETEIVARNNVMRPPILFLEYDSPDDTDILQEYFIPATRFVDFIDRLRDVVVKEEVNLLSVTLRHVSANEEALLSYARQDSIAVVLYINQKLSANGIEQASRWTQQLVDAARQCDGTYYLIYQRYPKLDQLRDVYPHFDEFVERKREYDPGERFMNRFFDHYVAATGGGSKKE